MHWRKHLVALRSQEAIHRYKYSMFGGFPLAPVEMLNRNKIKEGHSKLFIAGGGSNTLCQEAGMGQCQCWGSTASSLTKAKELWDQGSQIPSWHTGAPHSPLTALTQIHPRSSLLISPLISPLTSRDSRLPWEVGSG